MGGIYIIFNVKNLKVYVGQSIDVMGRLYNHRHQLRSGKHPNIKIQKDFDDYGEGAFEFYPLEGVYDGPLKMTEREQYWISFFDPSSLYNIALVATSYSTEELIYDRSVIRHKREEQDRKDMERQVNLIDLKTGFVYPGGTLINAAQNVGVSIRGALIACRGGRTSLAGFKWTFNIF